MMGPKKDLKTLANSILDSYEMRVRTVSGLMEQAYHFIQSFELELKEMIVRLKDNLAKTQSLRKKDFDGMISDIMDNRQQREKTAQESLELFLEQEEEMVGRLRNVITGGSRSSLEDIEIIKKDISIRQKEREKNIMQALKRFQIEQEELRAGLKSLLSKGEGVKVKDLRIMLKSVRTQQGDRDAELVRMLDDFNVVRDRVQTQWQSVARVSN